MSSSGMSSALVSDSLSAFSRDRFSVVKCFQKGGGAGKGALGICPCCWSVIFPAHKDKGTHGALDIGTLVAGQRG